MIRDESVSLEQLRQHLACSADYAAGLIDAVTGDRHFAGDSLDWCEPDEHVRSEYRAGFAAGEALLQDHERHRSPRFGTTAGAP
jgi:hypothetical protein